MRLAVVFSMILAATSFAQTERVQTKKNVPVQTVDLNGTEISGGIERPLIEIQTIRERPIFKKLIQIRGSFANELNQSVDAIR